MLGDPLGEGKIIESDTQAILCRPQPRLEIM